MEHRLGLTTRTQISVCKSPFPSAHPAVSLVSCTVQDGNAHRVFRIQSRYWPGVFWREAKTFPECGCDGLGIAAASENPEWKTLTSTNGTRDAYSSCYKCLRELNLSDTTLHREKQKLQVSEVTERLRVRLTPGPLQATLSKLRTYCPKHCSVGTAGRLVGVWQHFQHKRLYHEMQKLKVCWRYEFQTGSKNTLFMVLVKMWESSKVVTRYSWWWITGTKTIMKTSKRFIWSALLRLTDTHATGLCGD